MLNPKRYLITAALPYANGPLHIGHLAGAYLPSDIYARFMRSTGREALFVCGSDEHGAAITISAFKQQLTPQQIIDKYHNQFKEVFSKMNISFDIFHRTSSDLHRETSQAYFLKLYNKGIFEQIESEQFFDTSTQKFLADRYIMGICPKCGFDKAYGDQCENCGSTLSPDELIEPHSSLTGIPLVKKKTTHWYLPLNRDEAWLKSWLLEGKLDGEQTHDPADWKNHVLGQCKSWLDQGLQARAMTRDLDWGIDVPKEIPNSEGKKLYVWMDAPIGYISASKAWALQHAEELKMGADEWKKYWQDDETAVINFIGKDNIVFHCITFPAVLNHLEDLNLPYNVPANQFMNLEGQKISTSRNWAIWVHEYVEQMPDYIDSLRYYLIKQSPEVKDAEFTWDNFVEVHDADLVNNLSNFIHRVFVLNEKYFNGVVPEFNPEQDFIGPDYPDEFTFTDNEMLRLYDMVFEYYEYMSKFQFRNAIATFVRISSLGNQLLQNNEPWKKIKEDEAPVKALLFNCIQIIYLLAQIMEQIMPTKSAELLDMMKLDNTDANGLTVVMNKLAEGEMLVPSGHQLATPHHLFSKIPEEKIQEQKERLMQKQIVEQEKEQHMEPLKPNISFDDFIGMDLRVGEILEAEKVEKTDKLLKLQVDLGFEKRTVISGIAKDYAPEDILGKQVVLVANLEPKKIRGVLSHGMILMIESHDGALSFIQPESIVQNGLSIR